MKRSLSVVIPAFKQGKKIIKDIKSIDTALRELGYDYEIIVVFDGAFDEECRKIERLNSERIKVLGYKDNQGKGHAVRFGMLQSKGDIIGFIDAGMEIHPSGFSMLLNHMDWYNADIIVGSKLHPVSKVSYPFWRVILSWGYRALTRALFGFKIRDTQVGIKFFKRKVIKDVLPRLLVKKFAFDVEILAVAYSMGYERIYEAPVQIRFQEGSTIGTMFSLQFWKIIYSMLWDTAAVFFRLKVINYYFSTQSKKHEVNR